MSGPEALKSIDHNMDLFPNPSWIEITVAIGATVCCLHELECRVQSDMIGQ